MNALDLPLCAVCRTRVERVEQAFNPNANRGLGAYTLTAYCHGQRDVVDVSDEDLAGMVQGSLRTGIAFGVRVVDASSPIEHVELDMRDAAFSAPRPYVARSGFRYGADHGDTPNGPRSAQLNGSLAFRLSSSNRRSRTR